MKRQDNAFGNILRAARQGFRSFNYGGFSAYLRISESPPQGLLLEFYDVVPAKAGNVKEHICWWESKGETQAAYDLWHNSPWMQKHCVVGTTLPLRVILDNDGEYVVSVGA